MRIPIPASQIAVSSKAWLGAVAPALAFNEDGSASLDTDNPQSIARADAYQTCTHRGEQVDTVKCGTCTGNVSAKVFACTVHGRATLFSKPVEDAAPCRFCVDRVT